MSDIDKMENWYFEQKLVIKCTFSIEIETVGSAHRLGGLCLVRFHGRVSRPKRIR